VKSVSFVWHFLLSGIESFRMELPNNYDLPYLNCHTLSRLSPSSPPPRFWVYVSKNSSYLIPLQNCTRTITSFPHLWHAYHNIPHHKKNSGSNITTRKKSILQLGFFIMDAFALKHLILFQENFSIIKIKWCIFNLFYNILKLKIN